MSSISFKWGLIIGVVAVMVVLALPVMAIFDCPPSATAEVAQPAGGATTQKSELKTEQVPGSLSLLKDWSTWLVTIQTGILALVTFVVGKTDISAYFTNRLARGFVFAGVVCFAVSVIFATLVLGAIPDIRDRMSYAPTAKYYVQPIPDAWYHNIYNVPSFDWQFFSHAPCLWGFSLPEHIFFILGVFFFLAAILKQQTVRQPPESGQASP